MAQILEFLHMDRQLWSEMTKELFRRHRRGSAGSGVLL